MSQPLKGVCQMCGRVLEFPLESVGAAIACPHCAKETKLKPASVELLEAAPPSAPPEPAIEPDITPPDPEEARLRRSVKKLIITTLILVVILIILMVSAEWLSRLMHP